MVLKGLHPPAGVSPTQFEDTLARERPDLFTGPFSWPVMTLDAADLDHNMAVMAAFCARTGFELAPHIKTHMSRQLWQRQHAAGAWGATVATGGQMRTARSWGTRRLLLANQLLDPREIAWLAREARGAEDGFEAWVYADSRTGVDLLAADLATPQVRERVGVLIERGHVGGRTGVRTLAEVRDLAQAAAEAGLRVVGVSGYEGSVAKGSSPEALGAVARFCTDLLESAEAVAPMVQGTVVLSVGGSAYLDVVEQALSTATDRVRVIVRSGAYLTHDHGLYDRADPWARMEPPARLEPALRLWAQVHSTPEPGLVLCGAGRRDAPFDADLPIPLRVHPASGAGPARPVRGTTTRLNDQHLFLHTEDPVDIGEVIEFGVSHPCTSFDKWAVLPVLEGQRVVELVHTQF